MQIPCITYTEVHDRATTMGQRTTFVSPQAARVLRYAPAQCRVFARDGRLLRFRDDAVVVEETDDGGQRPFDEEYRIVARDGRVVWVRDVATVVRDEEGTPLYSQGGSSSRSRGRKRWKSSCSTPSIGSAPGPSGSSGSTR